MKKTVFTALLAALALAASLVIANEASTKSEKAVLGQAAPDFTLTSASGNEHSLSDFKGKIVVLEWVNHSCPFVRKHYSAGNMQRLQREYTTAGVVWLTICSSAQGKQGWMSNDDIQEARSALQTAETAYLVDATGDVGRRYDARRTPEMYIIDADGTLVYHGAIDSDPSADPAAIEGADNYVAVALNSLISGQPIATAQTRPYGCTVKY